MIPRSRRPSAEVQAARAAAKSADLREKVELRRMNVATALVRLLNQRVSKRSKDLVSLQDALREALVQVEILIEHTIKLEKAERDVTHE